MEQQRTSVAHSVKMLLYLKKLIYAHNVLNPSLRLHSLFIEMLNGIVDLKIVFKSILSISKKKRKKEKRKKVMQKMMN